MEIVQGMELVIGLAVGFGAGVVVGVIGLVMVSLKYGAQDQ